MVSESESDPKAWSRRFLKVKKFHRLMSGRNILAVSG